MEQELFKWVSSTDLKDGRTLLYYHSNGEISASALEFATVELADKYAHVLGDVAKVWVTDEAKLQLRRGIVIGVLVPTIVIGSFLVIKKLRTPKKESKSDI